MAAEKDNKKAVAKAAAETAAKPEEEVTATEEKAAESPADEAGKTAQVAPAGEGEKEAPAPAAGDAVEKVRDLIKYVEEKNIRKDLPHFQVGDTVRVSIKVTEKDKSRVQNFDGVVLRRGGRGPSEVFTVRRMSFGVGVEKTFPINSPVIVGIKLLRAGVVRRARLYYLRGLSGREARIKEDEQRLLQARAAKSGTKKAKAAAGVPAVAKVAKRRVAKGKKKDKRASRRKAKIKK